MPSEPVYEVEASILAISEWPEKRKGYCRLVSFLAFVILYLVIVTMQLKIGDAWAISAGLQQQFAGGLANVQTQNDFWNYLIASDGSGLMNAVFINGWYNGQVFSTDEQGFVMSYDKLVGGMLLVQQRVQVISDGCVGMYGTTSYNLFYPDCYTDNFITDPRNSTDPQFAALSPNPMAYDSTTYNGYAAFFGVAAGSDRNLALAQALQNALWTDKQTRVIQIKFAVYNGNYNAFSFVKFTFYFDKTGIFPTGNHMESQTIQMEPYRTSEDMRRLTLEIIFMVYLSLQIWEFCIRMGLAVRQKDWETISSLWNVVDASNLACLSTFVGLRVLALWMIYNNPITVPTSSYQPILEQVASIQDVQAVIIFITVMLSLIRIHKYYQFQERLAVLNNTFGNAFTDLCHFMFMTLIIFGGFAIMAHFLFGISVTNYSSVGKTLETLWEFLLGNYNYFEIDYVSPIMAGVYFVTITFALIFVMLNILVAIFVKAYAKAAEEAANASSVASDVGVGIFKIYQTVRRSAVNDESMLGVLERAQSKGIKQLSETDIMSSFGGDTSARQYPGLVNRKTSEEETEEDIIAALREVLRENDILRQRLREAGEDPSEKQVA